ncbi:MAG TPA: hypothetical protein PLM06_05090 [Anaerolineae bacterium]|nr:hypothetical protein [Anaerolineae bacterium]
MLTLIAGAIITLAVFSYLLGDNLLYRWALALLVGSGVGYALAIVVREVLLTRLTGTARSLYLVPLILGALLLLKGFPRFSAFGNISMGFIIGVGAAVAVSGALLGTVIPQVRDTGAAVTLQGGWSPFLDGLLALVGTILALFAFSPRVRVARTTEAEAEPPRSARLGTWVQQLGRGFITVALAVAFGGALTSALTLFIGRWWAVVGVVMEAISRLTGS